MQPKQRDLVKVRIKLDEYFARNPNQTKTIVKILNSIILFILNRDNRTDSESAF